MVLDGVNIHRPRWENSVVDYISLIGCSNSIIVLMFVNPPFILFVSFDNILGWSYSSLRYSRHVSTVNFAFSLKICIVGCLISFHKCSDFLNMKWEVLSISNFFYCTYLFLLQSFRIWYGESLVYHWSKCCQFVCNNI